MSTRETRFHIHNAQKIAAALLLAFLLQSLWLLAHRPLDMAETRAALAGRSLWSSHELGASSPFIPGDSVLALRSAGVLPSIAKSMEGHAYEFSIYAAPNRWLVRLPFVVFGVWLGAALWWVARRLFGDEGAYVALGLYCFSPAMLVASATVNSSILTSWGLFGLVFTAIGVAHTLYAPPSRWRPRIALLGLAIGLTAAADLSAALAGLLIAAVFMIYLAPGRRLAAVLILGTSCAIASIIFLACFGFNTHDIGAAAIGMRSEYLKFTARRVAAFATMPGGMLEIVAFVAALLTFLFWKRTRYFGPVAPLIVALLLPWWPGQFVSGASIVWSLPFGFVFIGGIYADLLERQFFQGRFRKLVAKTAFVLVGASAALCMMAVIQA
jgi:hypothetical protein